MHIIKNGLLLLTSIIASFFLFLVTDYFLSARLVTDPDEPIKIEQSAFVDIGNGWYELKKNYRGINNWGPNRYLVSTDKYGFRKNEDKKDTIAADIVFLGDSFTYGVNGPWKETFVGIYEEHSGLKVLNAGVGSYSPTAYLHQYKKAVALNSLKERHKVVVGLDISDIQDEATRWEKGDAHPVIMVPKRSLRKYFSKKLLFTKTIYRYLKYKSYAHPKTPDYFFDMARAAFTWQDWSQLDKSSPPDGYAPLGVRGGLEKTRKIMAELSREIRKNNSELYILIYPWPAQLKHKDIFSWEDYAKKLCAEIKCSGIINMFPIFRELSRGEGWYEAYYLKNNNHFNHDGNKIIANELTKFLGQR